MTPKDARLVLLLMLRLCAGGNPDEERHKPESPCELKTVTVSTLPVLRENEFSFTGAGSGSLSGGESRLLLFVRTDLPGRISVLDDLDNTALPYFTLDFYLSRQKVLPVLYFKSEYSVSNDISF
ncbi:putative astrotactin-2-like [Triplophysa rosa]|uniref:Astrotactin-2-like n=1 Tax=Triplophysa rosa TaxID=992332 RepID=A0A9W8CAW4_TRIRA|nr:putative astrotactin-2-like [Triplophysa rosa]